MNTTSLKSFAPAVRRQLMEAIGRKLDYVLTADTPDLRQAAAQVASLRKEAGKNRAALIDRVAYTWFNRLAALRFLDALGWHPFKARVLTPATPEETQPELLKLLRTGSLPAELHPHTDLQRLNDLPLDLHPAPRRGLLSRHHPQTRPLHLGTPALTNHLTAPILKSKITSLPLFSSVQRWKFGVRCSMFAFPHESPQLSTQFSSNLKSKIQNCLRPCQFGLRRFLPSSLALTPRSKFLPSPASQTPTHKHREPMSILQFKFLWIRLFKQSAQEA